MSLSTLAEMGATNAIVLVFALLASLLMAVRAVHRIRQAEEVELLPLVAVLAAPLAFTVYALTLQFAGGDLALAADVPAAQRQTMLAMALSRAVTTQIVGGAVVVLPSLVLILGCVSVADPGERPRLGLAGVAAVLTIALTATALGSGAASGAWGLAAIRAIIYLTAGLGTTAALLTTHHRGPGAQIGPIAAAVLPLLVAGLDATASGWHSAEQFLVIANSAPADRQAVLLQMSQTLETLRAFSSASVLIAVVLAGLGPAASAYQRHPLLQAQAGAVAMSMLTSIIIVLYGGNFLVPFLGGAP